MNSAISKNCRKTRCKTIIVCIQFSKDYPHTPLLIELKSKSLSVKLLDGLTEVCEKECKNLLGKAQVMKCNTFLFMNLLYEF